MKAGFAIAFLCIVFPISANAQWGPERKLSSHEVNATLNENMGPCLAVSGKSIHVVWGDQINGTAIYYKHSTDGGVTWGEEIRLSGNPGASGFPSLAVSGSTVHVVFRDNRTGKYGSYYKRSLDGGDTWGSDVFLGDTTFWPSVAAAGSLVYVGLNNDVGGNTEVFCVRSTNNGATFEPMQQISNAPGRSEDQAIAAAGDYVHMVWNDKRTGVMQTWYRRSSDRGVTWGPETQLTHTTDFAYFPTLCVNDSNVDVVMGIRPTSGAKTPFDIYHEHSTDFGATWMPEEQLTHVGLNSNAMYPVIARAGSHVHVAWMGAGLTYLHSSTAGTTWEPTVNVVSAASKPSNPFIAIQGSSLHLIWVDRRDGHGAIYYKCDPMGNDTIAKK